VSAVSAPGRGTGRVGGGLYGPSEGSRGGEDPSSGEVQATVDEVAQVEGGCAAFEPGVVGGDASVAEFEASSTTAGDLGDDTFDVGPMPPVAFA